jgi:hypothetical protein
VILGGGYDELVETVEGIGKNRVFVKIRMPTNSTSARTYGSSRSTLLERITEESLPSGMTSPDQGKMNPNELT